MKVYTTADDTGLVWTDPEIFKRFAIGHLIRHAKTPDELKEAYANYAGMSADDLVNSKDTAGSWDVRDDVSEDDLNKMLDEPETYNNLSLRDLYESNDDTDPFGKDFYDFLDSTMPERDIPEEEKAALEKANFKDPSMLKAYAQDIYDTLSEADSPELNGLAKLYSVKDIYDKMANSEPGTDWDDSGTVDAFVDGLMEDAKGRWHELEETSEDVNNDGDIDVVTKDVDNDGTADEATVIADDKREAEDATSKAASEMDVEPSIKDTMIDVAKKAAKQQMKDEADKEIIDKDISDDLSDLLSSEMDSTGNLKLSGNILNALRDIRF